MPKAMPIHKICTVIFSNNVGLCSSLKVILTILHHQVPLRMGVDAISFSAHADFPQTSEFIDELQPKHVVLVHGEATEMGRLKRALEQRPSATGQQRTLYMPRVTQPVHITHKPSYTAKVRSTWAHFIFEPCSALSKHSL